MMEFKHLVNRQPPMTTKDWLGCIGFFMAMISVIFFSGAREFFA